LEQSLSGPPAQQARLRQKTLLSGTFKVFTCSIGVLWIYNGWLRVILGNEEPRACRRCAGMSPHDARGLTKLQKTYALSVIHSCHAWMYIAGMSMWGERDVPWSRTLPDRVIIKKARGSRFCRASDGVQFSRPQYRRVGDLLTKSLFFGAQ
jgi:hypothetical protein